MNNRWQNSFARVLTKIFRLVTYVAGSCTQTYPHSLQQVCPQCNTEYFSMTAKERKQGSLLMCFWCSYRELLMRAPLSSKRQKSNDSWLPSCRHRHHPPLPGTAHPAPTPARINFIAFKRAEENPSPQARAKSIPGLLPCPTCREAFHTLSCPRFTQSQAASKSLHWYLVLNRLLNGRWTYI